MSQETTPSQAGLVLVAGPWARTAPAAVNPSYFSPRGLASLSSVDPDPRWRTLVGSGRSVLASLIGSRGAAPAAWLPPDWAAAASPGTAGGAAWPISGPGAPRGAAPSTSSFDAVRVPIRLASSCRPEDRRLAAALWPLYQRSPGRDGYSLNGQPASGLSHASSFVAAAASAQAAGHAQTADRLLGQAQAENSRYPTYYGAAWLALGRVLLTTSALGGCSP